MKQNHNISLAIATALLLCGTCHAFFNKKRKTEAIRGLVDNGLCTRAGCGKSTRKSVAGRSRLEICSGCGELNEQTCSFSNSALPVVAYRLETLTEPISRNGSYALLNDEEGLRQIKNFNQCKKGFNGTFYNVVAEMHISNPTDAKMILHGEATPRSANDKTLYAFSSGFRKRRMKASQGGAVTATETKVGANYVIEPDVNKIFDFKAVCGDSKPNCSVKGMKVCMRIVCKEESDQAAIEADEAANAMALANELADDAQAKWTEKTHAEAKQLYEQHQAMQQQHLQQMQQMQQMQMQQQGMMMQQPGMMMQQPGMMMQAQPQVASMVGQQPAAAVGAADQPAGVQSVTQQMLAPAGGGQMPFVYSAGIASAPGSFDLQQAYQQKMSPNINQPMTNQLATMTSQNRY